jgi:hypothetical protein
MEADQQISPETSLVRKLDSRIDEGNQKFSFRSFRTQPPIASRPVTEYPRNGAA